MRLPTWKKNLTLSLYLKCSAILLLISLSILIVACGSNTTNSNLGQPDVTVTINLGDNGSPTPPLPAYTCSIWVTNTSPGLNTTSAIGVYAKFIHNVNDNPEGVYPATGSATVLWPDGATVNVNANTTSDGLAVFSVSTANRSADLNKITRVVVSFQGPAGVPPCTVSEDRAAFFTLVIASPSATSAPSPTANPSNTATASPSASPFPTVDPTVKPTVCPTPKSKKTPTPCPGG